MTTLVIPQNYKFLLSRLTLKGPCNASRIQIQVFLILHQTIISFYLHNIFNLINSLLNFTCILRLFLQVWINIISFLIIIE